MLFPSYKIMISWKKNQYQINIILPLQKPHPFTIAIWYGANMCIPDKIPNSWKCENPMLIWYLFNKCGWLGSDLSYLSVLQQQPILSLEHQSSGGQVFHHVPGLGRQLTDRNQRLLRSQRPQLHYSSYSWRLKKDVIFIANILYNQRRSLISTYLLVTEASKISTHVKWSKWIQTKTFSMTLLRSRSRYLQ